MKYFEKISGLKEEYERSPRGLLYVAPTGSGKTLKMLQATRGTKTTAITPASLTKNLDAQEMKFFGNKSPRTAVTYAKVSRGTALPGGKNLVMDESHNIRNPKTKAYRNLVTQRRKYDKALLATATPMYNEPYDIVPQVNMAAGKSVVSFDKKKFYDTFYKSVDTNPGFVAKLMGIKPGSRRILKDPVAARKAFDRHTYVVGKDNFKGLMPGKNEQTIEVDMSPRQEKLYKYYEGKLPFHVRYKMKKNILPSKTESKSLNTFLSAVRQVSNTTRGFEYPGQRGSSPKMTKMVSDATKEISRGGKVLMYSNFRASGTDALSNRLRRQNIPHGLITGSTPKAERARQVKLYTTNKVPVMVYSGAGAEGINLPKTTLVQTTEPYWNKARINQAEARGIRRGDDPTKNVKVNKYVSTFSKKKFMGIIPMKRKTSVDQYLQTMSNKKNDEIKQLLTAIRDV